MDTTNLTRILKDLIDYKYYITYNNTLLSNFHVEILRAYDKDEIGIYISINSHTPYPKYIARTITARLSVIQNKDNVIHLFNAIITSIRSDKNLVLIKKTKLTRAIYV